MVLLCLFFGFPLPPSPLLPSFSSPPLFLLITLIGYSDPYCCVQVLAAGEKMSKDMRGARERSQAEAKYSKRDASEATNNNSFLLSFLSISPFPKGGYEQHAV